VHLNAKAKTTEKNVVNMTMEGKIEKPEEREEPL
jgi:hypothetical protein